MNCPWDQDQLWEFIAGKAERPAAEGIRAHLDSCADCRRAATEMRGVWALMERDAVGAPSPEFTGKVLRAAGVEPGRSADVPAGRLRALLRIAPWAAAAVIVLAVWIGNRVGGPGSAPDDGTTVSVKEPPAVDSAEQILDGLPPQERELVAQLDLLENLDAAQAMEIGADEGWGLEYVDDLTNLPDEEDF